MEDLTYEELLPYATPRQAEILELLINGHNKASAANQLGLSRGTIRAAIDRVRIKAANRCDAPKFDRFTPVPPGYGANTSTRYDWDEKQQRMVLKSQWVKTYNDKEQLEEIREAILEELTCQLPRSLPVPAPIHPCETELCNLYIITDYHLGMKADAEVTQDENGDWDTKIAEKMLLDWFSYALHNAPDAQVGILCQLGDFLHWDGLDAVTPQHKNILDADDRFHKLVRIAIRVFRQIITMMLEKHDEVHIIHAEGNHDLASSVWLREIFHAFYDDEPRVTVDVTPDPYYCFEFGNTSLFFHHGHKRRITNIDDIFVAKYRNVFGRTKHSYAHMGHLHHDRVIESNLMTVEQHRTLAAKDAFAARGGWMADRTARAITYHREFGKVYELSISPEMLKV